jgi:Sulfotransferase family
MMGMLQAAGCELMTDSLRKEDYFNPKGYFEFEPVKNLKHGDNQWLKHASGKVVKIVSPLLQYLPDTYSYKIIFMRRDLVEVLTSQTKMLGGLQKTSDPEEARMLEKAYQEHLSKMEQWLNRHTTFQTCYVSYNQLLSAPREILEQLAIFLERPLQVDRMIAAIDPNLYRNRRSGR